MQSNYRRLGDYIRLVDERNRNLEVTNLVGLTINKNFIPSVANIVDTDMSTYKIIRKNQFACSVMQVRRDKKMPVALWRDEKPAIISQAYPIFEIVDEQVVSPDYLIMWFTRSEFDREACFLAVGGVRGSLEWEDFLNMKFPLPSLEQQKEIVAEYEAVEQRIQLNKKLCEKLEETAQTIYRNWFEDFEFPVDSHCEERGMSDEAILSLGYKSSGGEMVECEELGKEIPKGWRIDSLTGIANYKNGLAMQNFEPQNREESLPVLKIRELGMGITDNNSDRCSYEIPEDVKVYNEDVIFSWSGTLKIDFWIGGFAGLNQHLFKVTSKKFPKWFYFLWTKSHLDSFIKIADGNKTSLGHIKREHLDNAIVLIPTSEQLKYMTETMEVFFSKLINIRFQTQKLEELKSLLLGKIAVEKLTIKTKRYV